MRRELSAINRLKFSDDLDSWRAGQTILATTIRSFKGLVADVVLLLIKGNPTPDSLFTKSDFYVACSRAKHLLYIFSEQEIE